MNPPTLRSIWVMLGVLAIATIAWASSEPPPASETLTLDELKQTYRRPAAIPFPSDNKRSKNRETLGKSLFFDPRLSGSNFLSCATCHNPALAWGDGLPKGIGHGMKELGRRTPTILNVAWAELLFWDGRADTLEAQALGPMQSPNEMNATLNEVVDKLQRIAGYRRLFQLAYPNEGITPATIGKAIATYERTIVSGVAPFDLWIAGKEDAIPESAKRGFGLFNTKAKCAVCHSGWNFTDSSFYDTGLDSADIGRGKIQPNLPSMQYAFKTPTLRNVDRRAPYMHDGSLASLRDVVEFYDKAGVKRPSRALTIQKLKLSRSEENDLVAFMRTLTSVDAPVLIPVLPR